MKQALLIMMMGLISHVGFSQSVEEKDFSSIFARYGVDGCFVLYEPTANEYIRYNSNLCDSGYIPASTFKIPHSLIALQEAVVTDTNQVISWDGHVWPNKPWNQDQTLKSAMKLSCIWVYIGFAEQIGIEKYLHYMNAFEYGNQNLTGPPTRFWLAGEFRITANQQIDFLHKFYNYELPEISRNNIDLVKDIIVIEQTDQYAISGKTGGGVLSDSEYVMWLVGYVEVGSKLYYYAMNFTTNDFGKTAPARLAITKEVLNELKFIKQ
jgi:beta-lactamase class D